VQDGTIYPLEFKKTAAPRKEMVRHFGALERLKIPVGEGGVVCLAEISTPLTEKAVSIPVGAL
jgi:hypothetical protein